MGKFSLLRLNLFRDEVSWGVLTSSVQVSNVSDQGYLGIHRTLNATVPLLQTPVDNPHATLITFFLNAVDETLTAQDRAKETFELPTKKHISGYLPSKEQSIITQLQAMIKDYSHIFERMREAAKSMGTVMK
ncbi:hypothetical protein AnigIFM56816_010342 [Aspergillus niger]|nr:hypothetical protein AnigIFM56816_010342 [Aspergillus niger]